MFKFTAKQVKNSVSDILSDFETKIQELKSLSERKAQEVTDVQMQITTLETVVAAANAEAQKASRAADKIAKFLAE